MNTMANFSYYIKELEAIGLPVNTTDIILYAKTKKSFENRSIISLRNWTFRFIKRMGFCFRVITKANIKTKENISEYVNKFYIITRKIIEKKIYYLIKVILAIQMKHIFSWKRKKKNFKIKWR